MHLIALVESPEHVCCRYRLTALMPYLVRAGHSLEIRRIPRTPWDRLRLGYTLRDADAVVIQRKLFARWELCLLRAHARKLIFDFDDAIWIRDSYDSRGPHCPRRVRRFAYTCRSADAILAGNDFLAVSARRWAGVGRVHVVPTAVDPALYPAATHTPKPEARLVWIGSTSTLQGLSASRELLETIGETVPGVRLRLICDRPLPLARLSVEFIKWSQETEAAAIAECDIGIGIVPDDLWSRGKCGLKLLQYMAGGLPVVANPVGVHAQMVRPGQNGLLAMTAADWVSAIRKLLAEPDLRQTMGQSGRAIVEAEYSPRAVAALWCNVLEGLQLRKPA